MSAPIDFAGLFKTPAPWLRGTGPHSEMVLSTRIRLATSQPVVAAARLADGSVWARRVDVLVPLAACVEG